MNWVTGSLLYGKHGQPLIQTRRNYNTDSERGYYCWNNVEVIPSSVGQYTGLEDKSGKKIFEGDVINALNSSADHTDVAIVQHEMGTFSLGRYWKDGEHDWYSMEQYGKEEMEVIGNVTDNPELLT